MPIQLNPKQLDMYNSNVTPENGYDTRDDDTPGFDPMVQGSGSALTPEQQQMLDQDEGPIRRQPESQVFDGSQYSRDNSGTFRPGVSPLQTVGEEARNFFLGNPSENTPENEALYNKIGEPGPFGTSRIQHTNENGVKESFVTPPPGSSPFARIVGGGAMEAVKGVLGAGEWLLKNAPGTKDALNAIHEATKKVPNSVNLGGTLLDPDLTDTQINWISENFPTVTAQNDVERLAQELISMGAGGTIGAQLTRKVLENPAIDNGILQIMRTFTSNANRLKVGNVAARKATMAKALATELIGSNGGQAIATPQGTDSVTGGLLEGAGVDPQTADRFGNFLDNTTFSGLLGIFHMAVGGGKKVIAQINGGSESPVLSKNAGKATKKILAHVLTEVDPDLKNVTPEEFGRKATIFSNSIQEGMNADVGQFGQWKLSPSTTLDIGAARTYVDNAYPEIKEEFIKQGNPDGWTEWSKTKAQEVANNMNALVRSNMDNTRVSGATSVIMDKASNALQGAADKLGTSADVNAAGITLADNANAKIGKIRSDVEKALDNKNLAEANMKAVQSTGAVMPKIKQQFDNDPLGSLRQEQLDTRHLAGTMAKNVADSDAQVNEMFKTLPTGINWDREGFAKKIIALGRKDDTIAQILNLDEGKANPVFKTTPNTIQDNIAGVKSPLQEKMDELESVDLSRLYNQIRPRVVELINNASQPNSGILPDARKGLIDLKKFIDKQAKNSNDPEFKAAMDRHILHEETYEALPEGKQFANQATNVLKKGYGNQDLERNGGRILENAFNGGDKTGHEMEAVIKALTDKNGVVDPKAAEVLVNRITRAIQTGSKDGYTSANAMIDAVKPYVGSLEQVAPDTFKNYNDSVLALREAEAGFTGAATNVDKVKAQSQAALSSMANSSVSKLLTKMGNDVNGLPVFKPTDDITKQLNNIFSSTTATKQLMQAAEESGDPTVLQGLKQQYLRKLVDDTLARRKISVGREASNFVPEGKQTGLYNMLHASDTTPKEVMETVFKDDPKTLEDVGNLLAVMETDIDSRSVRPQTFSSQTPIDLARNDRQKAMSLLIASTLGVLNATATKAGRLSGLVTEAMTTRDKDVWEKIMPTFLVDSEGLTKAIDTLIRDPSEKTAKNMARTLLTRDITKNTLQAFATSNLKGEDWRTQTNKAFDTKAPIGPLAPK